MRISDWSSDVCSSDLIIRDVRYAQAFSFKYSPRPGTPAADMAEQVSTPIMDERLQRLQALVNQHQYEFNQAAIGKTMPLLLERPGRHAGQLVGKSPWLQSVHVQAQSARIGDMIEVDIVSAGPNRSEDHPSELQSLMRISYAVFCLTKNKKHPHHKNKHKANPQLN